MKRAPWILGVALLAACRPATSAEEGIFPTPKAQPVTAELITEHASVQPGGQTRIGVHFELEEGWHIYAQEPGDAGLPTSITWSGPAGVSFAALEWPKPQEFNDPGDIHTFGYSGAVTLSSLLKLAASASPGTGLALRAKVKWLACHDICIPGAAELELALPVTDTAPRPSTHAELFAQVNP